jgi:transcriptional regulator with XRE-family HTH domain
MIREARERIGLSQSELAQLLVTAKRPDGVWSTYIGQIEKGDKLPSEEICLKLAEVLDLDPITVLLGSYRERADTEEAQQFIELLSEAACEPALTALLLSAGDSLNGLLDESMAGLLASEEWAAVVGALCRSGRIGDLPQLLGLVQQLGKAEWDALLNLATRPDLLGSNH